MSECISGEHAALVRDGIRHDCATGEIFAAAPSFATIDEIRRANRRNAGGHWFSPGARRFFGTRLDPDGTVYGGRWFLASHEPPHGPRFWAIHRADVDGSVDTVGLELFHEDGQTDKAISETVARWLERFDPVPVLQDAAVTVAARAVNESTPSEWIVSETAARRNPYGTGTVQELALAQLADRDGRPTTIGDWLLWRERLADIGRMARETSE